MTEKLSSWDAKDFSKRGVPSENLVNVYRRWGEGGFGVILTGNIMIAPDQLEDAGNAIIPRDAPFSGERFEAFQELSKAAKAHGSIVVGQVSHPGRQTAESLQPHPISASDVQLEASRAKFAKPRPANEEDIRNVIEGFAHAAEYLEKAGFDGIELHGAHGYLLAQFLSSTTNLRTDQYGGALTNRMRLVLEVAAAVRARVSPSFILCIKINSVEFQEGGITPDEARTLCEALEDARFDFVELSGGTYQSLGFAHRRESTRRRESFFLDFAESIVQPLKRTKTYITGGLRTVGAMNGALATVDGIGLARPATQDFDLPRLILNGKVSGAIHAKVDQDDFGLTNMVAGTQIRQVGKDQQPMDMSNEETVESFYRDLHKWKDARAKDTGCSLYGYVDLSSDGVPYASLG